MFFDYDNDFLYMNLDDGETLENEMQVLEQLAYSIDVTFGELLNEGYPVSWGNNCAAYEFSLFIDGDEWLFSFSNRDFENLIKHGETRLFVNGRRYQSVQRFITPYFGPCSVLIDGDEYLFVYANWDNNGCKWLEANPVKKLENGEFLIYDTFETDIDYCNSLEWAKQDISLEIVHMMENRYSKLGAANGE